MLLAKLSIADRLAFALVGREPSRYVDVVDRYLRYNFGITARSLDDLKLLALFY